MKARTGAKTFLMSETVSTYSRESREKLEQMENVFAFLAHKKNIYDNDHYIILESCLKRSTLSWKK